MSWWYALGWVTTLILGLWTLAMVKTPKPKRFRKKVKSMIVLGSGGHTAEMFNFLQTLDLEVYSPRIYVIAATDVGVNGSEAKAHRFEEKKGGKKGEDYSIQRIPRSREVGQSMITSVGTTLWALLHSLRVVWRHRPDLILTNGPGTCVPICFSAFPLRPLHYSHVVFVESVACVSHLSLSGRILSRVVDRLFVQWDSLLPTSPKAQYTGRLESASELSQVSKTTLPDNSQGGGVLVTVGSTEFNALMEAIDDPAFLEELRMLGYSSLRIQYGRGGYVGKHWDSPPPGLQVESFPFTPSLEEELRRASLVISHAGAGSIIEALTWGRRLVVVPNEGLMANHQWDLANKMDELGFSFSASLREKGERSLSAVVRKCHSFTPKPYPPTESNLFRNYLNEEMNVK